MALNRSKCLVLSIFSKNGYKYIYPLLTINPQFLIPVVNYSNEFHNSQRISRAVEAYLERTREYDKFLKEQLKEFNLGKEHLANIMGKRDGMTQKEIDEAIRYLFPSKLFDKLARPMMKPPEFLFMKKKEREFDDFGKPFHHLFYTTTPNFSQLLHDAAKTLEELNLYETNMKKAKAFPPDKTLYYGTASFLTKQDLEGKLLERLLDSEYEKFVEVFERLKNHLYNYVAEDFIKPYIVVTDSFNKSKALKPTCNPDGSLSIVSRGYRKTATADVTMTYPGTGKVSINGRGIDYFLNLESRAQIMFPLLFTDMLEKVDFIATVEGGGTTSQAGAIRLALSLGLEGFVPEETRLKMKIAGLFERDIRRKERKKCGQEGARRKYTWLKR